MLAPWGPRTIQNAKGGTVLQAFLGKKTSAQAAREKGAVEVPELAVPTTFSDMGAFEEEHLLLTPLIEHLGRLIRGLRRLHLIPYRPEPWGDEEKWVPLRGWVSIFFAGCPCAASLGVLCCVSHILGPKVRLEVSFDSQLAETGAEEDY